MTFFKCPFDGYNMDLTEEIHDDDDELACWKCRGCGFIAVFDLEYPKKANKK